MKSLVATLCIALTTFAAAPVGAQAARPADSAVSESMESVQKSIKKFEDTLDDDFKRSTLRGETAEVDVQDFLKDFNTDIKRMRERFKPAYSASAEVSSVLQKASRIDAFIKSQPPAFKGRSEWDVAASELMTLASAYQTKFPAPADAVARRVNDKEIQQSADVISKDAKALRKAIGSAFTKEEGAALSAAQKNIDALAKAASNLKARSKSGKPASGEAGVLAEAVAAVQTAVTGRTLSEKATASWTTISAQAQIIEVAFRSGEVGG